MAAQWRFRKVLACGSSCSELVTKATERPRCGKAGEKLLRRRQDMPGRVEMDEQGDLVAEWPVRESQRSTT